MLVFTWELFMAARKVVFKLFDRNTQSDQRDDIMLHVQTRYLVPLVPLEAVSPVLEKNQTIEPTVIGPGLAAGDMSVANPSLLNECDLLASGRITNVTNCHDDSCRDMSEEQQLSELEDKIKKLINSQLCSENAVHIRIHNTESVEQIQSVDARENVEKSANIEQYVSSELMSTLEHAVETFMSMRYNHFQLSEMSKTDSTENRVPPNAQGELLAAMDTFVSQCTLRSSAEATDIRNGASHPPNTNVDVDHGHVKDSSATRSNSIVATDGRCVELAQAQLSGTQSAPSSGICLSAITSALEVDGATGGEKLETMSYPETEDDQTNVDVDLNEDEEDKEIEMLISGIISMSASAIAEEIRNAQQTAEEKGIYSKSIYANEVNPVYASNLCDETDETNQIGNTTDSSKLQHSNDVCHDDDDYEGDNGGLNKLTTDGAMRELAPSKDDVCSENSNIITSTVTKNEAHTSKCAMDIMADNWYITNSAKGNISIDNTDAIGELRHNEKEQTESTGQCEQGNQLTADSSSGLQDYTHSAKNTGNTAIARNSPIDSADVNARETDDKHDNILSTNHNRGDNTSSSEPSMGDIIRKCDDVHKTNNEKLIDSNILTGESDVCIEQRERAHSDLQVDSKVDSNGVAVKSSYGAVPHCNFRMLYSEFVQKRSMPGLNCISDMVTDMMSSSDPQMCCRSLTGAISRVTNQQTDREQQIKKKTSQSMSIDNVDSAAEMDISIGSDGTLSAESLRSLTSIQEQMLNKVSTDLATNAVKGAFDEIYYESQSTACSNVVGEITKEPANSCNEKGTYVPMSDRTLHYRSQITENEICQPLQTQRPNDYERKTHENTTASSNELRERHITTANTLRSTPTLDVLRKLNAPVAGLTATSACDVSPNIASKVAANTRKSISPAKTSTVASQATSESDYLEHDMTTTAVYDKTVCTRKKTNNLTSEIPSANVNAAAVTDNEHTVCIKKNSNDVNKSARYRKPSGNNKPRQLYATPTPIKISKDVTSFRQKPASKLEKAKPQSKSVAPHASRAAQTKLAKIHVAKSANVSTKTASKSTRAPSKDSISSERAQKKNIAVPNEMTPKTKLAKSTVPSRTRHLSVEPAKSTVKSLRPRARSASVSTGRPPQVTLTEKVSNYAPEIKPLPNNKCTMNAKPIRQLKPSSPIKDKDKKIISSVTSRIANSSHSPQRFSPKTKTTNDAVATKAMESSSTKPVGNSSNASDSEISTMHQKSPNERNINTKFSAEKKAWLSSLVVLNSSKAVATQSSESVTSDIAEKTVTRPYKMSSLSTSKTSCTVKTNSGNKIGGFPKWNAYPAKSDAAHSTFKPNKVTKGEKEPQKDGRQEAKSEQVCNRTPSPTTRRPAKKPLLLDAKRANTFRNLSKSQQLLANSAVSNNDGNPQMKTQMKIETPTCTEQGKIESSHQYWKWNQKKTEKVTDGKKSPKRFWI